jgi:hypothetical protein
MPDLALLQKDKGSVAFVQEGYENLIKVRSSSIFRRTSPLTL